MAISYHPNQRELGNPRYFARGWKVADTEDVRRIAAGLLRFAMSPVVFVEGRRARDNYLSGEWLALDFDDGPTIAEARETFANHVHIIGTTKSHQKPKGKNPPCDRFRLLLKLLVTITDRKDYETTLRHLVHRYGADPQCVDAARFFWPCKEIVSLSNSGQRVDVVRVQKRQYTPLNTDFKNKIPYWVQEWLQYGVPEGTRNKHCFKTACWLTKNGFSEDEIVSILMSSAIPKGPEVIEEVKYAVRSGRQKALKEVSGYRPASGIPNV
jgi:hypothetical protein